MEQLARWWQRIGAAGAARNAGRVLAERRRAERAVESLAGRVQQPRVQQPRVQPPRVQQQRIQPPTDIDASTA